MIQGSIMYMYGPAIRQKDKYKKTHNDRHFNFSLFVGGSEKSHLLREHKVRRTV